MLKCDDYKTNDMVCVQIYAQLFRAFVFPKIKEKILKN